MRSLGARGKVQGVRKNGFSLIEVTVAVAIIGMMVVATGALFARIPVNGREVRDQDLALKIARGELESLRAAGYAALPANGPFANELLSSLSGSAASVTVTDVDAETKQADVSVTWLGSDQHSRTVSLVTLITESCALP